MSNIAISIESHILDVYKKYQLESVLSMDWARLSVSLTFSSYIFIYMYDCICIILDQLFDLLWCAIFGARLNLKKSNRMKK